MKFFFSLLLAVSACAVSCERHDFEGPKGTKQLNEAHGSAASHDEHPAAAGHSEHSEEKPAAH
jgi:hypothetical protein